MNGIRLLTVLWLYLIGAAIGFAQTIANQFDYPIDPWVENCNGYWGTCNIPDAWHLGTDIGGSENHEVYASGNGVVKRVALHNSYGYVVIIKHILPNGEVVCSLSGHLKSNVPVIVDQMVMQGDVIGYLASPAENGGWDVHLHYAIKKGPFNFSGYNYTCNGKVIWGYSGYTRCADQKSTWYNPAHFLIARSSLVGNFSDGSISDQIVSAYVKHGKQQTLGSPVAILVPYSDGHVTEWPWLTNCLFQVFNRGDLGDSAILYDQTANTGEAFPMHGQLWDYYLAHDGPNLLIGNVHIGGPVDQERYATADVTGHKLVVQQMAHGYLVYDTVWGMANARTSQNPGFTMALVPGDGVNLTQYTSALTDTSIYVSWDNISQTVTEIYRDSQLIASISGFEFTIDGLQPQTSYTVYLIARNADGIERSRTNPVSVMTKTTIPPSVPLADFEYWMRPGGFEIGVPTYSGATIASIVVGSQSYQATPNTFYTVSNLDSGTYSVHVELFNGSDTLIAASVSKTITVGNMISVIVNGTSHVGPNGSGVGRFIVYNGFSSPIYDWQYRSVSSNDTWLILDSDTFPSPGIVPAYGSVTIEVPFTTLDCWNAVTSSTISIWAQAKCDSSGRPFVQISGHYTVAVEPFKDLWLALPQNLDSVVAGQLASITLTISNESNQTIPPTRLWIYVDDTLVVDVLVPQLASRELWQPTLALGSFPEAGTHEITVVVDPLNEVAEAIEDTTTVTELGVVDRQEYVLYPTADTRIYLNSGQTSVVDPSEDILRVSTRPQNSLLAFDLPAIPSGYEVEAELQLYLPSASEYNADSWLYVEPLTQAWDQSTVNWYSFSTPVGTYAGTGASLLVPAHGTGSYDQWLTFDLTADVWNQLNGTAPNCGFVVWMAENPSASGNNALFIASREYSNPDLRPRLVITASLSGEVTRTIETNNVAVRNLVVTPPPQPNLLIQNVTVNPSSPTTEDQLNLDVTVKNTGAETAPGSQLEVDSTDSLVAPVTDNIPSLPAGAETTVTVTHPAVNSGIVGFSLDVDPSNAVTETDEADNDDYVMLVVSEPGLTPTVTPTLTKTPTPTVLPTVTASPTPTYVLQSFTVIADRATRIYGAGVIDPNENNIRTQQADMIQHGLVHFTLPSLPAGFQVTSATLRLYLISQRGYVSNGVTVYRLTRNWDEAATNWYQARASQAWANSGGDYTTAASAYRWIASKSEGETCLYQEWQAWDVTGIFTAWTSGQPNYGLMLIQDENVAYVSYQQLLFGSDEAENPSYQPQLVIEGYVP